MKTGEIRSQYPLPPRPKNLQAIPPTMPVGEALKKMSAERIHHLLVVTQETLVGLLAYTDVQESLTRTKDAISFLQQPASKIMRTGVPNITEETQVHEVLSIMREQKLSALPIVSGGRAVGIVTNSDMLWLLEAILRKHSGLSGLAEWGEELLARPLVQRVMKLLSDAGL